MNRLTGAIGLVTLLWIAAWSPIVAGNVAGGLGANGQHARPFYIVAHNPNALSEATEALEYGANALEPDIMRFDDGAYYDTSGTLNSKAGPSGLFMYHDDVLVTSRMPETVESYFDHVHNLVKQGKNVALLTLDIKSPAAEYMGLDGGKRLRHAVATHLNHDGVNVNIIYSVGTTADSDFFMDNMCLGPREGLMIDGENDPVAVLTSLQAHVAAANRNAGTNCDGIAVPDNIAFGNGSFGVSSGFAPNVLPSIVMASWLRAGQPGIGNVSIPYAYPIELSALMHQLISSGVDGLIPDYDIQPQVWGLTLVKLAELWTIVRNRSDVYLATVDDNPFEQPNEAYGLRVDTVDEGGAGTDANLTFKLIGSCGSAQVTLDASYQKLFESGNRNHVTIQSKNLGLLQRLEVSSDGSCSFLSSDTWNPGVVQISSARWGIPYSDDRKVDFNGPDVCAGSPATIDLGNWGVECDRTAPSASPDQSPAANRENWNAGDVTVFWNWADNAGGSGIDPTGCTSSSVSSGEGAITLTATCRDREGNIGHASRTVHVDTTAPGVSCATADVLWHVGDVSLPCGASDTGSGLANPADAQFNLRTSVPVGTDDGNAFTSSRVVFDRAGNTSAAGPIAGNKVDKKSPSVGCGAADGLWHATDTSVSCNSSDTGSGLARAADASFSLSTSVPIGTDSANAFTSSRVVVDQVGNASTAGPVGGHKVDKKAPAITIDQPAPVPYVHSATLTLGYGVTDSGSGVATVTPVMDGGPTVAGSSLPSGRVIDLLTSLPLGQHTFTIDAVDSVGNASPRASVTFTIIVTAESVIGAVNQLVASGGIGTTTRASLMAKLGNAMELRRAGQCEPAAQVYAAFINQVRAQTGKSIEPTAAAILIGDAQYLIANCP